MVTEIEVATVVALKIIEIWVVFINWGCNWPFMSCSGRSDSSWIAWMKIVISSVDRSFFMFQFVTILALPVETEVVSAQSNDQVASKVSASASFIYVKSSALDLPIFLNCYFVGELHACSVGTNFTPHVITINAGEVHLVKERDETCSYWFHK